MVLSVRISHAIRTTKDGSDRRSSRYSDGGAAARMMLATSAADGPPRRSDLFFSKDGGVLCKDRKGFFEHFNAKPLFTSVRE